MIGNNNLLINSKIKGTNLSFKVGRSRRGTISGMTPLERGDDLNEQSELK
jgi:hypothetical protein